MGRTDFQSLTLEDGTYWLLLWVKCLLILDFILVIVQLRILQPRDDLPASAGLQSGHHLVPQEDYIKLRRFWTSSPRDDQ